MKKLLTICVFAFALLISTQGFAQKIQTNNSEISVQDIKDDVVKLAANLNLNDAQIDALSNALLKKNALYTAEKANLTAEVKNKIESQFLQSLKGILTEEQIGKLKSQK